MTVIKQMRLNLEHRHPSTDFLPDERWLNSRLDYTGAFLCRKTVASWIYRVYLATQDQIEYDFNMTFRFL